MSRSIVLLAATWVWVAVACGSSTEPGASPSPDTTADADTPGGGDATPDVPADVVDATDSVGDGAEVDAGPPPFAHAGVTATAAAESVTLRSETLTVTYDLATGRFEARGADGTLRLTGAESRAIVLASDGAEAVYATSDPGTRSWDAHAVDDPLGAGVVLVVRHVPTAHGAPELTTSLALRADASFLTVDAEARWPSAGAEPPRVSRLSPLVADEATGGALFVGPDPMTHRVLDNGFEIYIDFEAHVLPVGAMDSLFFPPGIASNWNAALFDPVSEASVVAGFLSHRRGIGMVVMDHRAHVAPRDAGRSGFTRFEGLVHYLDGHLALPDDEGDGAALASEPFYVDLAPPTVFDGLESFATRYAERIGKTIWTEIPSGWNSWGGGAGSGGYGTTIDEALMLANLEAAARDFAPFGMRHFMIDDGWQPHDGDWFPHPERFPDHDGVDGMAWLAEQIRQADMIPGIWISPFDFDHDSQLAQEHPEWAATVGPLGIATVPGDVYVLDLSRPDVLDWLAETFHRITQVWGYKWIKLDFSYYALFTTELHDPQVTATEAYVNALEVIREAVGPETFLLTVAVAGLGFDAVDGNRISLDNEPWWGDEQMTGDQGVKVTYQTVARRYYLNHRLWVNHPDLLFYRDDYDLTLEEARAWTSVVALTGGIVKLGESYLAMAEHPEWRAMVTPLLPIYPQTGRPLDLFEREYPETWLLPVEREGRRWHVLGLFNWGLNRDIDSSEWEPEAEQTRTVELAALGVASDGARVLAFDAWRHTWRWVEGDTFDETLAARTVTVLVLRPEPEEPAAVFTSRHLLGGAVELAEESWDPDAASWQARLDAPADVPLTVYLAPAGREVQAVEAEGAAETATWTAEDGLVVITFTSATADPQLVVAF